MRSKIMVFGWFAGCAFRVTGCGLKKEIVPNITRNAQLATRNADSIIPEPFAPLYHHHGI
jgi:hypothetical protein